MTQEELREIIAIDENYRIELTTSTGDMDKFQEAICAFANDMPGSRKKGYLLIGVKNNGQIDGLKVDDALMKKISGMPTRLYQYVGPIKELGLILPIYPDNPRHPQQKYYLTEIGLEVLKLLDNNEKRNRR